MYGRTGRRDQLQGGPCSANSQGGPTTRGAQRLGGLSGRPMYLLGANEKHENGAKKGDKGGLGSIDCPSVCGFSECNCQPPATKNCEDPIQLVQNRTFKLRKSIHSDQRLTKNLAGDGALPCDAGVSDPKVCQNGAVAHWAGLGDSYSREGRAIMIYPR